MTLDSTHYYTRFGLELFEGALSSHVYPWHYHDCYTIVLVEKGSMKYVYADKEVVVKTHHIHVVNPFVSHYNFPVTPCEYKAIFLPINNPSSIENHNSLLYFEEEAKEGKKTFTQLSELFSRAKSAISKSEVDKIQVEIGQVLFQTFACTKRKLVVDRRIIPALEFINKNLDKKITVKEVADTCCLSHFHFQRLFKEAIGLTVNDFIQQQRTTLGKNLIRKGNQLVDTAVELGYYDQSHFNKSFKKMWVGNPTEFK